MSRELTLDLIKSKWDISNPAKVENLSLHGLGLSSLDSSILNTFVNLQVLDVSSNCLRDLPRDLCLPKLKKLDCSDNRLDSVSFLSSIPSIEELHIMGNGLPSAYKYMAFALCTDLKQLDQHKTDSLKRVVTDTKSGIEPHIDDVWDKKYADKFENDEYRQEEDFDDIVKGMSDQVLKRHSMWRSPLLAVFGKFMINHLCHLFVDDKFKSVDKASRSPPRKRARHAKSPQKTPKKSPVAARSLHSPTKSPLKSLKKLSLKSPEKRSNSPQTSPVKSLRNPPKTPDKPSQFPPKSPIALRSPQKTPLKSRNSLFKESPRPSNIQSPRIKAKSSPKKYTSIVPKKYSEDTCPETEEYDPVNFIRCHFGDKSAGFKCQDPSDNVTEVWACEFEPSIEDTGATKSVVATCGGEYVCLIDCSSGHVMQRFHQPQMAYSCLAWTTLNMEQNDKQFKQNVLVVAGRRGRMELILPIQHLWYGSFGTDRPNQTMGAQEYGVNCLRFHQAEPRWLFAGGSDGAVELWDIGTPEDNNMKANVKKLAVFCSNSPQIICMLWIDCLDFLLVGTDTGLCGWKVDDSCTKDKLTKIKNAELKVSVCDEDAYVDSLTSINKDLAACKVVGHGEIIIFKVKSMCVDKKQKKETIKAEVLFRLEWISCQTDFIQMNYSAGHLVVGDNEGGIWMYYLEELLKLTVTQRLKPSCVLQWPECDIDGRESEQQMIDLKGLPLKPSIVVNSCSISSNASYVVGTTSNNLVCIWKSI